MKFDTVCFIFMFLMIPLVFTGLFGWIPIIFELLFFVLIMIYYIDEKRKWKKKINV